MRFAAGVLFAGAVLLRSFAIAAEPAAQPASFSPDVPAAVFVERPRVQRPPPQPQFDPRTFGAKGDGSTYDTAAIQKAVDACAGSGGSVVLTGGKFVSAQLTLREKMTFYVDKSATLLGGLEPNDYPELIPEGGTHSRSNRRSLIYACNADGLIIDGEGTIDGRGPKVKMSGKEPQRPSLIRIFKSSDVIVRNITLRDPKMWTQVYIECKNLELAHVTVDATRGGPNLDGMDICDSEDVRVHDCRVDSEDDAICLKSHGPVGLNRITVENNLIRCRNANGIKLGTATVGPVRELRIVNNVVTGALFGGLCIESVDGSVVDDVHVSGLEMKNVGQPIFVRLARRGGVPFKDDASKQPPATQPPEKPSKINGSITNVTIERVRATRPHERASSVSSITGVPGLRVRNVTLRDVFIEMPGGQKTPPGGHPAEKETAYPQSNLLGPTPAWAFYVRHADNVVFENVRVVPLAPDVREWLVFDQATVRAVKSGNAPSR